MNAAAVGGLLLVDTDVLIDDLRDEPGAVAFLEATEQPLAASAITIAELDVGVRDGVEQQRLDAFVGAFEEVPLDRQATARA